MGQSVRVNGWKAKQNAAWAKERKHGISLLADMQASSAIIIGTFAFTLFLSAALLFIVEPMVAKMLLPLLGGSPSVWTTCMMFFQTVLLAGYVYAHGVSRFHVVTQANIHLTLLLLSAFFLPVGVSAQWSSLSQLPPVLGVICVMAMTIGFPFFAISATAPLLQNWFAHSGHKAAKNPYFLYGASNLGSFLALFCYPMLIEPTFGLSTQSHSWAVAFGLLIACMIACRQILVSAASRVVKSDTAQVNEEAEEIEPLSTIQCVRWVLLAFAPSSLMSGVTTYFTTDIATIPLLWTIPLGAYLLSFIIVFAKWPEKVHRVCKFMMPPMIIAILFQILSRPHLSVAASLTWHLGTFLLVALVCHGEMARTRPSTHHLTKFFLLMSFGGMLGGVFNALIAPVIFQSAAEYAVGLVVASFLVSLDPKPAKTKAQVYTQRLLDIVIPAVTGSITYWLVFRSWTPIPALDGLLSFIGVRYYEMGYVLAALACGWLIFFKRSARVGLGIAGFASVGLMAADMGRTIVHKDRSFFGILKVTDSAYGDRRTLTHGTTLHGTQFLDPVGQHEPLTYYHRQGPVGSIFREFSGAKTKDQVAFIGLGTGTLATYGQKNQKITYYEIDDAVVTIAKQHFTYLRNSKADINIVMGDARLKLKEAAPNQYGLIFVDAFSSDAIPVHLLTREAIQLYLSKLQKDGVIAIHTSNRYLALEPILGRLAKEARLEVRVNSDRGDDAGGKFASTWVILTRETANLGNLAKDQAWAKLEGYAWTPLWSDDHTSLFGVLK